MQRRTFITGVGAAGAATLAAGGWTTAARADPQPRFGYAVGERFPTLEGPDQYQANGKFRVRQWTLIDVTAWWCVPCRSSATQHRAFTDYLNGHGIPFTFLSVMVESSSAASLTAARPDAEIWAWQYGLEPDVVLHCAGDEASPYRLLAGDVATANGSSIAYPCYVLLDPDGVIRLFHNGFALNEAQAVIAAATGVGLDRTWAADPSDPRAGGQMLPRPIPAPLRVTGSATDGRAIDETLADVGSEGDLVYRAVPGEPLGPYEVWVIDENWEDGSRTLGFDHDTPITFTYDLSSVPTDSAQVDQFVSNPSVRVFSLSDRVDAEAEVTVGDHTVTFSLAPLSQLGANPSHVFDTLAFNSTPRQLPPYSASLWLAQDLAASPQVEGSALSELLSLVEAVQAALARRDFGRAATKAAKLNEQLAAFPWSPEHLLAESLARHLGLLATQGPAMAAQRIRVQQQKTSKAPMRTTSS